MTGNTRWAAFQHRHCPRRGGRGQRIADPVFAMSIRVDASWSRPSLARPGEPRRLFLCLPPIVPMAARWDVRSRARYPGSRGIRFERLFSRSWRGFPVGADGSAACLRSCLIRRRPSMRRSPERDPPGPDRGPVMSAVTAALSAPASAPRPWSAPAVTPSSSSPAGSGPPGAPFWRPEDCAPAAGLSGGSRHRCRKEPGLGLRCGA